ncbi:MAG: FAD-dependent oxidoreductase [Candidatus Onthomonas sp.]
MESIWWKHTSLPTFPALEGDVKTDVLVIGGGITGLLCAWSLTQAGVDCLLAEADTLCSGVTGNTTAKITAQHRLVYHKLLDRFGPERTKLILSANLEAVERYRSLCREIDCDFVSKPSYVYTLTDRQSIDDELRALYRLGYEASFVPELLLPFPTAGAVRFSNQAQFHPLKFLSRLAQGLRIYEHTPVLRLEGMEAVTPRGRIRAEQIIVATHFPFLNRHGAYFLKLYQHRSYVLALENAPDLGGMYVDDDSKGLSFRNADGLLLLGGGSHRTGGQGGNWDVLSTFAHLHYPTAREVCRWAAQDCMSLDEIPYIGRYGRHTPRLYVASGFNKWGMTSAMAAAELLTDLVLGRENEYAAAFRPHRSALRPQLAVNAFEATANLLSFSTKRCPHMGCALRWNKAEHTWDCPCHGSRFDEGGRLINNPAMRDTKL